MHVPKPVPSAAAASAGGAHAAAAALRCDSRCCREAPLGVKPEVAAAAALRGGAVAGRAAAGGPRWLPRRCGGRYDIGDASAERVGGKQDAVGGKHRTR